MGDAVIKRDQKRDLLSRLTGRVRRRLSRNETYLRMMDSVTAGKPRKVTRAARRSRGGTELHAAIARGDVRRAAELLDRGIDRAAKDTAGLTALCPKLTPPEMMHAVRQQYQVIRAADHRRVGPDWPQLREVAERGIVKLPGFIDAAAIESLQHDCASFVDRLHDRNRRGEGIYRRFRDEEHFWPEDRVYFTNNAFRHSPRLVSHACRESVLKVVRHYFGRPVHVQRALAMRYLPGEGTGRGQFGWHHDLEGRRLKLVILLSEVSPADHTMSYVARSHRIDHPYHRYQSNCLSLDYCARRLGETEIVETTGQPGDAYLFDSNGAHVANRRSTGQTRDRVHGRIPLRPQQRLRWRCSHRRAGRAQ